MFVVEHFFVIDIRVAQNVENLKFHIFKIHNTNFIKSINAYWGSVIITLEKNWNVFDYFSDWIKL